MKKVPIVVILLSLFTAILPVSAEQLSYDIYTFKIRYGSVLVSNEKRFEEPINMSLNLMLPHDARGILLYINRERVDPIIYEGSVYKTVRIEQKGVEALRINYISDALLDSSGFLTTLKALYPTENIQASLTLEPSLLKTEIGKIYPEPNKIDVDGQSPLLIWERTDLQKDDELSIWVPLQGTSNLLWIMIPVSLFLLILGFYLYYARNASKRKR